MLVKHRSGIPDYTRTNDYWTHPKDNDKERLAEVLDLPAHFEPGTKFEYSNTNYLLLSKIMSKVLGYDKFEYIQKEILNPLNLKQTFGSIQDVSIDDVMSGYYVGYDADLKTDIVGSMLATAEDLSMFIRALNDGSVLEIKRSKKFIRLFISTSIQV